MEKITTEAKAKLRKIKRVDRGLEMTLDSVMSGTYVIQFCRDVQLYGLYEALLYAETSQPENNMTAEGLDKLVDYCLASYA